MYKNGIRTNEFFKDHDKLRSGVITESQVSGTASIRAHSHTYTHKHTHTHTHTVQMRPSSVLWSGSTPEQGGDRTCGGVLENTRWKGQV